jgi:hemerythrin-like domain-containing protein
MTPNSGRKGGRVEPGAYETDTSGMARAHGMVERSLENAPRYVSAASEPHRVAAVASFYENVLEYVHVHHSAEDELLYPLLEERCADDLDAVERIWSQHDRLRAPMAAAGDAIDQWRANPTDASAAAIVDALRRVLEVLTPHCRDEERVVVALASRHLSQDEWASMLTFEVQSYTADRPWLMLGLALEQSDEAHREALLSRLPEARRTLWTDEWSPAFQAFMADVRPSAPS